MRKFRLRESNAENCVHDPDPPTLVFWKEQGVFPPKRQGFSLRRTPKILGKGKTHKKDKDNRNKKQGKKQGLEG